MGMGGVPKGRYHYVEVAHKKQLDEKDAIIAKLEKKLEISKNNEAVLCPDCRGKEYITKDSCILCAHERRVKQRLPR